MAKKYIEIYEKIKSELGNKYPVGSFLPTEQELMLIYSASRTTIRHAIALLRDERLLEVCQGRGTRVLLQRYTYHNKNNFALFHNVSGISASILSETSDTFSAKSCVIDTIPATGILATKLGVAENTLIYRLERILYIDKTPFAYFRNYFRRELLPHFDRFSGQEAPLLNVYRLLEKEYGIFFEYGEETISARLASLSESKVLDMDAGMPLLVLVRIAYTRNHETMEYSERVIRPEMLNLIVSMSGAPHYY